MIGNVSNYLVSKMGVLSLTPCKRAPGLIPIAYARRNHGSEKGSLTTLAERH